MGVKRDEEAVPFELLGVDGHTGDETRLVPIKLVPALWAELVRQAARLHLTPQRYASECVEAQLAGVRHAGEGPKA